MTDTLRPYDVSRPAVSSDVCDYCDEGSEYGPHFHELFVSRDGAASRTADNLARVLCDDVASLAPLHYSVPEDLPEPAGWCDDPEDSEYLTEEMYRAESAAFEAGFYVILGDGYVICRIVEDRDVLRTWEDGPYWVELFDARPAPGESAFGRYVVGYELRYNGASVFLGSDFSPAPSLALDSDESLGSLLAFLSLRDGDTDAEYFDGYSAAQLAFRDGPAEELAMLAYVLENGAGE